MKIHFTKKREKQTSSEKTESHFTDSTTIASCAVKASYDLNAKLIIVFTYSGQSAQTVAHYRPKCPILAVTPNEWAAKALLLHAGMHSMMVGSLIGRETLQGKVILEARKRGLLNEKAVVGEFVVLTSGLAGDIGNTN